MKLHCADCGKYMGEVRDANLRNGMVVLCAPCNDKRTKPQGSYDIPDFLRGLMGGRK